MTLINRERKSCCRDALARFAGELARGMNFVYASDNDGVMNGHARTGRANDGREKKRIE